MDNSMVNLISKSVERFKEESTKKNLRNSEPSLRNHDNNFRIFI